MTNYELEDALQEDGMGPFRGLANAVALSLIINGLLLGMIAVIIYFHSGEITTKLIIAAAIIAVLGVALLCFLNWPNKAPSEATGKAQSSLG